MAALGLATTGPGDDGARRSGCGGMCPALPRQGLGTNARNQCASLGSIKCDLVEAMYNARQGNELPDKQLHTAHDIQPTALADMVQGMTA